MLCFAHIDNKFGEICTNRCPERPECKKKRIPFLIEALDILASDIEVGESNGVFFTSFKSYCIAPEAYINGIVFEMHNPIPPRLINVKCHRPGCGNQILMPLSQEEELMTDNYTKYNKNCYIYCSKECQDKHIKKMAESKSVASGTLKNHEFALKIYGADTTKRLKEREKDVITGTITEQRARCLREKLIAIVPRKKKKCLTSKEVQDFLLNELPASLKASPRKIEVTAWFVMNKTIQLFPNEISISYYKEKSRYIELII